ncbi:hypothetical protein HRI_001019300 [Hibiscus trionum]|uniref:Uncharacterized protein n=1 Tax=Hibiscus trionum TaxID=183268 RepID=A0A9W7H9M3_HIBTR|nr:hypothetical protein HRI_001019300 [Hibiscus trionum]
MDIEPWWTLGGWFFLCFFDCMAPASPLTHAYEKTHFPLLLLTLFFVLLLLSNPSTNPIVSSNATPSIPFKRLLLLRNSSKSSTMNLHPRQRASSSKSSRREFGAEAHEVPSGPNPISNR